MALPIRALAPVPEAELAPIAALLRGVRILQDLVQLGFALRPPLLISDVVIQDEYTHDVILPLRADRYLVFDAT